MKTKLCVIFSYHYLIGIDNSVHIDIDFKTNLALFVLHRFSFFSLNNK